MTRDELLDMCVDRLGGEYRCVVRPSGSVLWVMRVEPVGWLCVPERQVLRALHGMAGSAALSEAVIALRCDERIAVPPGMPFDDWSEERNEYTYL